MRLLNFTIYSNAYESLGTTASRPWTEWLPYFLEHKQVGSPNDTVSEKLLNAAKLNSPALILGKVPDYAKRGKDSVEYVDALSLDLEHINAEQIAGVFDKLEPWEYVAYTTHKSGSVAAHGEQRWRVILPLAESIMPEQLQTAWQGLNKYIGGFNDPSTKDISRLNLLPTTFDLSKASTRHHRGKWVNLPTLIQAQQSEGKRRITDSIQLKNWIRRLPGSDPLKSTLHAISQGTSFADTGSRHSTIVNVTWRLARQFEELPGYLLRKFFGPSLEAMAADDSDAPDIEEVLKAYEDAVQKINEEPKIVQRKFFGEETAEPYTDEELNDMAVEIGCTVPELTNKWVIFRNKSYYFLIDEGFYEGPFCKDDAKHVIHRMLARAPIELLKATKTGYVPRNFEELVAAHGTASKNTTASMVINNTYYDAKTRTMHEAVCPRRNITPKEHPEIDHWLRLLGGRNYSKLVDWLSVCADLKRPLCALYFAGSPGAGKQLFADALTSIWSTEGAVALPDVIDNFNSQLVGRPILFADEEIPRRGKDSITAFLRSLISAHSRSLRRKFIDDITIQGSIRLVLAANNENMLESKDVSTRYDFEAIAKRFLFINVDNKAKKLLESMDKTQLEYWVKEAFAEHVTWLERTHVIEKPGKRFAVEGESKALLRVLLSSSRINSLVLEWLVRYLMDPQKFHRGPNGHLIQSTAGMLLVNDQALADSWFTYLDATKTVPSIRMITTALKSIVASDKRIQKRIGERRVGFRVINLDHIDAWAKEHNLGDSEVLTAEIRRQNNHLRFDRQLDRVDA